MMKNKLRIFWLRMTAESLLTSAACGLCVGLSIALLCGVADKLFPAAALTPFIRTGAPAGIGLLMTLLLFAFRNRPSRKRLAYQLDALGLEERVGTMLQLEQSDSFMARVQREDALQHLNELDARCWKFHLPTKSLIAAVSLAALLLAVPFLPTRSAAPEEATPEWTGEMDTVATLLNMLHQQAEQSGLSDEDKAKLMRQLEELSQNLPCQDEPAVLRALAKAEEVQKKLKDELSGVESYESVLANLMAYPIFRPLGQAIFSGNTEDVRVECNRLTGLVLQRESGERLQAVYDLLADLTDLLAKSDEKETDGYLVPILRELADGLLELSQSGKEGEAFEVTLAQKFLSCAQAICEALNQSHADDRPESDLEDRLGKQEDNQPSEEGRDSRSRTGQQNSSSGIAFGQGYAVYGGEGITGLSAPAGAETVVTESLYEPSKAANLPYTTVYGKYYADMLALLQEADELPKEVRNAIEAYFAGL